MIKYTLEGVIMLNENLCTSHCSIDLNTTHSFNLHNLRLSAIIIPVFIDEEI